MSDLVPALLAGKVAVVTGAGGGIGQAVCTAFARAGAVVSAVDLDEGAARATIQAVERAGGSGIALTADVTDAAAVAGYVEKTVKKFGRIDVLFNNAGIEGVIVPTPDYPEEVFDRVMAVNVRGVFLGLKFVLPVMLQQRSGSIINTSSLGGLHGTPGMSAYIASKHAVIGLTRTAALEFADQGIRVNAVCPGAIETSMLERISLLAKPEDAEWFARTLREGNPSKRNGTPEEVASVVVFLASDAASFVNGIAFPVCGGFGAQ